MMLDASTDVNAAGLDELINGMVETVDEHPIIASAIGSASLEQALRPKGELTIEERNISLDLARMAWSEAAARFAEARKYGGLAAKERADLLQQELFCLRHLCLVPYMKAIAKEREGDQAKGFTAHRREEATENLIDLASITLERAEISACPEERQCLTGFHIELATLLALMRNNERALPTTLRDDHHDSEEHRSDVMLYFGDTLEQVLPIQIRSKIHPYEPASEEYRAVIYGSHLKVDGKWATELLEARVREQDGRATARESKLLDKQAQTVITAALEQYENFSQEQFAQQDVA